MHIEDWTWTLNNVVELLNDFRTINRDSANESVMYQYHSYLYTHNPIQMCQTFILHFTVEKSTWSINVCHTTRLRLEWNGWIDKMSGEREMKLVWSVCDQEHNILFMKYISLATFFPLIVLLVWVETLMAMKSVCHHTVCAEFSFSFSFDFIVAWIVDAEKLFKRFIIRSSIFN